MNNPTTYQVVTMENGRPKSHETNDLDTYEITGFHTNEKSRAELIGQPILSGFCGPMYNGNTDGVHCIRYESTDAYRYFST